jgi:hypothetical protein
MDSMLPTLSVIAVIGLVHTITSHYRDKAKQQRKRELMRRLGIRIPTDPD